MLVSSYNNMHIQISTAIASHNLRLIIFFQEDVFKEILFIGGITNVITGTFNVTLPVKKILTALYRT